jgi:hypothetical protein
MDIKTAKEIIKVAALVDDTVIMEGLHGIGKSNIVKQFAKENNYHLEELFLSHNEVGDLIGIPRMVEIEGCMVTDWSIPIWLQRMNTASQHGKHCILFLDELNRAPIDVRQASLQLVLERQIHQHELPLIGNTRTLIIAAINPADNYQVDELDPALLDRFLHIKIKADAKTWLAWARKSKINRVICDFIAEYDNRLHYTPKDGDIGTSPRSWAKLSDYIDNCDKIPNDILVEVINGKLGSAVGAQFYSFYRNYVDVVKIADIEKLVKDNKDNIGNIEELAELITKLIEKTEAIQKSDMCYQLSEKYMSKNSKKDILPFLAYLYALEVEICVAFLKSYRQDEPENYKKLALIDSGINNKKLFLRVISASLKK